MFDPVNPKQNFPDLERGILEYWKLEDTFKRSIRERDPDAPSIWDEKRRASTSRPSLRSGRSAQHDMSFSFYDGPPFATGLPHYGHLLAGTIKDVIPRYQTMRGHKVERRFGWDCHGLPVENLVEQEEGIRSRKEIEEKGVKWFNDLCRKSVLRYTSEWRKTVERMGRWVDMDWDYRTMDPDYMESIWWVFQSIYKKGLIYEGKKSMHVCPRCVTPLSNFEVTLGYKDVKDWGITAKFKLCGVESAKFLPAGKSGKVGNGNVYVLAWTTTGWTLPGNLFLAVNPREKYVRVKVKEAMEVDEAEELKEAEETYVVAEKLVESVFSGKEYEVLGILSAQDLIGLYYEPLFPYFAETYRAENAFRVVAGDFVTTEDGTGIVHIAPGFGDDDYQVGRREGVEVLSHVTMDGKFIDAVTDFVGEDVKSVDDPTRTDRKIAEWLDRNGKLFEAASYAHSYPHCWRCESPLINYATSSWFVSVDKIKYDMLKANSETRWVPGHIRDGRFGEWLRNARDWAISRNRYWGTPLPIWRADGMNSVGRGKGEAMNPGLKPGATDDLKGHWVAGVFSRLKGHWVAGVFSRLKGHWVAGVFSRLKGHLVAGGFSRRSGASSSLRPAGFNPQAPCNDDIIVIGSRDELISKVPYRFTKITALRHAESEGNLIPIYQGELPGTDLTERGREQAAYVAKLLAVSGELPVHTTSPRLRGACGSKLIAIYSSPLARTRQTAEIIAKRTGAKLIIDDRLREIRFGAYEGKTIDFSDLAFVKSRRSHKIEKGKPESIYHFDGMETWENTQLRIKDFLDETIPKHRGEHIAIVTHADPMNNIRHFFTVEDPVKLSHRPYPAKATPESYFWDHKTGAELDLHKDTVDDIVWCSGSGSGSGSVEVTLVRHGETDVNRDGKVQGGDLDFSLNDEGRRQATEAAASLRGQIFDVIVTSGRKRARETAEIIVGEFPGVPIVDIDLLSERNLGAWSGRKGEDVLREFPPASSETNPAFHTATPDGGESLNEFLDRMQRAAEELLMRYAGKRVLLVSHSGSMQGLMTVTQGLTYQEGCRTKVGNAKWKEITIRPFMRHIGDVLDCWFESGSMPYALNHYPFEFSGSVKSREKDRGIGTKDLGARMSQFLSPKSQVLPNGFPADFIAEGLDQTRGWFYTLMVLSSALFRQPAFKNCIVNGIVLAEDGKKMSKRLKNYPEPGEIMEKYGADAMRFSLMSSPAVRGENLRFSEKFVEETVRSVILPLWNAYSFFVLHANAACNVMLGEESKHPLDQWILAEVQDLVNRMTIELDRYDLSATCSELHETLDGLTNWYIRRSRRRFAGKEGMRTKDLGHGVEKSDVPSPKSQVPSPDQEQALQTLHSVLITFCQLLAPFCPFVTEAIYLNLTSEEHSSIHLTDWPVMRELSSEERAIIEQTKLLRTIVSLGMKLRAEANVKVRQPLSKIEIVLAEGIRYPAFAKATAGSQLSGITEDDRHLLMGELNVKEVNLLDDASHLADRIVTVNARVVGPRLGSKVQDIIRAAKNGEFTENADGTMTILGEILTHDEAAISYRGKEGKVVASHMGIVVALDTEITEELKLEGLARDMIRSIQSLRKENGLSVSDRIFLQGHESIAHVMQKYKSMIEDETNGSFEEKGQTALEIQISMENEVVKTSILFN